MRAIELTAEIHPDDDGRLEVRCPKSSRRVPDNRSEAVGLAELGAELEAALAERGTAG